MFECGLCYKQSKPKEKAFRVVTERRLVVYPVIPNAHRYVDREGQEVIKDDPGGSGMEIVTEVLAHLECAERLKSEELSTSV